MFEQMNKPIFVEQRKRSPNYKYIIEVGATVRHIYVESSTFKKSVNGSLDFERRLITGCSVFRPE